MPYRNVYGPVLQDLVALVVVVLKISPALAFHKTVALFYCLGPVTLFWMAYRFSGSLACGFWSGLLYSVVSPTAILIPAIRTDIGGAFHLRRLYNLVVYGEAPHIVALTLMPVALIAVDAAIRRRKPAYYFLSALAIGVLALTNVTGMVGFAMLLIAYILATPEARSARLVLIGVLAYALTIPWLPPSTIGLIIQNSQHSRGANYPLRLLPLLAAVAALLILHLATTRLGLKHLLRLSLYLIFLTGIVLLSSRVAIIPQPERFQLEFEMGCCVAAGFALARFRRTALIAGPICLGLLVYQHGYARKLIQPIDIRKTIEYEEAKWFDENMAGRRVFAPGSISFWMNVFTDTPQLGGCCDQGVPNFEQRVALYTIYTGQNLGALDGPDSLLWLQAYGVHAIGVSRRGSREHYQPFGNPDKFEGLLFVLWEDDSDVVYRVPLYSDSLAHVIRESQRIARAPKDGSDVAPLQPYVAAINDPEAPQADLQWMPPSHGTIHTQLRQGDIISIQVTYDPGWRAKVNGAARPIESDPLGMMIIPPDCTGNCTVELSYRDRIF